MEVLACWAGHCLTLAATVQVLMAIGFPGEYSLTLRSSGSATPSPPLTLYMQSPVATLQALPPRRSSDSRGGSSAAAGTAALVPHDVTLQLRFLGPDGEPRPGFRAAAVPVAHDGSRAGGVVLDAGQALGGGATEVPLHQVGSAPRVRILDAGICLVYGFISLAMPSNIHVFLA